MVVSVFEEAFGEEFIGKLSCLLEPVHALGEFLVYPAAVGRLFEFIFVDDFLRYHAELDACILWAIERRVEVEVFQVGGHEPCIWC